MALDFDKHGRDWPLRAHSRFVTVGGLRWHVQQLGQGPTALLIHGTGASTHSWRDVAPRLADRFKLIIPDLPGHAFTNGRPAGGLTIGGVANALAELIDTLEAPPAIVAGHSAGAAIACRLALDKRIHAPILGFGPALLPMGGSAAPIFSGMAKLLFLNPLAPRLMASMARQPGRIERFLARATGSRIDPSGAKLYARLFADAGHIRGLMEMMAGWRLESLARDLPRLPVALTIAHGARDAAIRPEEARRAANLAGARFELLANLGHLAHEERPELAAELIARAADQRVAEGAG